MHFHHSDTKETGNLISAGLIAAAGRSRGTGHTRGTIDYWVAARSRAGSSEETGYGWEWAGDRMVGKCMVSSGRARNRRRFVGR